MEPTVPPAKPTEPAGAQSQPENREPGAQPHPDTVSFRHHGELGIQAYNLHLTCDQVFPVPFAAATPVLPGSAGGRFGPSQDEAQEVSRLPKGCPVIGLCRAGWPAFLCYPARVRL